MQKIPLVDVDIQGEAEESVGGFLWHSAALIRIELKYLPLNES
jgi:hypothetical protein